MEDTKITEDKVAVIMQISENIEPIELKMDSIKNSLKEFLVPQAHLLGYEYRKKLKRLDLSIEKIDKGLAEIKCLKSDMSINMIIKPFEFVRKELIKVEKLIKELAEKRADFVAELNNNYRAAKG